MITDSQHVVVVMTPIQNECKRRQREVRRCWIAQLSKLSCKSSVYKQETKNLDSGNNFRIIVLGPCLKFALVCYYGSEWLIVHTVLSKAVPQIINGSAHSLSTIGYNSWKIRIIRNTVMQLIPASGHKRIRTNRRRWEVITFVSLAP